MDTYQGSISIINHIYLLKEGAPVHLLKGDIPVLIGDAVGRVYDPQACNKIKAIGLNDKLVNIPYDFLVRRWVRDFTSPAMKRWVMPSRWGLVTS